MKTKSCMLCLVLVLVTASHVQADIVSFTTQADLNAHMTGVTARNDFGASGDFQGLGTDYWFGAPYTAGSTRFTSTHGVYGSSNGFGGTWPVEQAIQYDDSAQGIVYPSYNTTDTALGMVLYGRAESTKNITGTVWFWDTVEGSVVEPFSLPCPASRATPVFLGMASTNPSAVIDFVRFDAASDVVCQPIIAGWTHGTYVPEPSTLTLATMAVLGLLAYAWRRRT